jgi:hypothetical protein
MHLSILHCLCVCHAIISHRLPVFFQGLDREVQDPDSSPRREEVGRRTLGDYGGFLLPFFYRARFRESTSTTRKRQARKIILIRLQSPREWKNRTRLDEYYFFYYLIPPEDDSEKKHVMNNR